MLSLKEFINKKVNISEEDESNKEFITINGLSVIYTTTRPITIEVADEFSIDDTLVYLDDMCLNKMPMKNSEVIKILGKNSDYISDVYFGYSEYTVNKDASSVDISWDPNIGGVNPKKLNYYTFKDLTYNVKFDKFEFMNVSKEELNEKLYELFGETFLYNKDYIIEVKLDKENIKYTEN